MRTHSILSISCCNTNYPRITRLLPIYVHVSMVRTKNFKQTGLDMKYQVKFGLFPGFFSPLPEVHSMFLSELPKNIILYSTECHQYK